MSWYERTHICVMIRAVCGEYIDSEPLIKSLSYFAYIVSTKVLTSVIFFCGFGGINGWGV